MDYATAWPAPAKINLFLHVVGRRDDGYHLLQTVFQFVDVHDYLSFSVRQDGEVHRVSDLPGVTPAQDLVVRAARALQAHSGTSLGVEIDVEKHLPMGGGLGGGSSNAATVLVALNQLWGLNLSTDELAGLGLGLGADVPVFVRGQTAWAEGVGEILHPMELPEKPIVIVTPDCAVETAAVFKDPDLTRDTPAIKMHAFSPSRARNDCEPVTRRLYPEVGRALDWLARRAPTRMSGTGASVFAFVDDATQATGIVSELPANWRGFSGRSLNCSPLLARLRRARESD